jgi:hypothetical protein
LNIRCIETAHPQPSNSTNNLILTRIEFGIQYAPNGLVYGPFPGPIKKRVPMLKNYFKIAFRSLWRHKAFAILNITGLAVGMSAFFLIYQYVRFEYSYDNFVTKGDRIYRLVTDLKSTAATLHWSSTSMPMAINLKAEYPEVENIVRFHRQNILLRRGDIKFDENSTVFADSSLFALFNFPLLRGNSATALKEPFSVILSESTAKKYFGDANPIGQTMQFSDSGYQREGHRSNERPSRKLHHQGRPVRLHVHPQKVPRQPRLSLG